MTGTAASLALSEVQQTFAALPLFDQDLSRQLESFEERRTQQPAAAAAAGARASADRPIMMSDEEDPLANFLGAQSAGAAAPVLPPRIARPKEVSAFLNSHSAQRLRGDVRTTNDLSGEEWSRFDRSAIPSVQEMYHPSEASEDLTDDKLRRKPSVVASNAMQVNLSAISWPMVARGTPFRQEDEWVLPDTQKLAEHVEKAAARCRLQEERRRDYGLPASVKPFGEKGIQAEIHEDDRAQRTVVKQVGAAAAAGATPKQNTSSFVRGPQTPFLLSPVLPRSPPRSNAAMMAYPASEPVVVPVAPVAQQSVSQQAQAASSTPTAATATDAVRRSSASQGPLFPPSVPAATDGPAAAIMGPLSLFEQKQLHVASASTIRDHVEDARGRVLDRLDEVQLFNEELLLKSRALDAAEGSMAVPDEKRKREIVSHVGEANRSRTVAVPLEAPIGGYGSVLDAGPSVSPSRWAAAKTRNENAVLHSGLKKTEYLRTWAGELPVNPKLAVGGGPSGKPARKRIGLLNDEPEYNARRKWGNVSFALPTSGISSPMEKLSSSAHSLLA